MKKPDEASLTVEGLNESLRAIFQDLESAKKKSFEFAVTCAKLAGVMEIAKKVRDELVPVMSSDDLKVLKRAIQGTISKLDETFRAAEDLPDGEPEDNAGTYKTLEFARLNSASELAGEVRAKLITLSDDPGTLKDVIKAALDLLE